MNRLTSAAVIDAEREKIEPGRAARLGDDVDAPWAGIGLSGGGIRSACFALGVLQGLAERDLLKRFDYISSVSGGGYLATSLQWWWHRGKREDDPAVTPPEFGLGPDDFPYGPAAPAIDQPGAPAARVRARANLEFLRAHSSYLTPGRGLNALSMFGVLARTVVISILIWIPLLTLFFCLLNGLDDAFVKDRATDYGLASPLGAIIDPAWIATGQACKDDPIHCFRYPAIYALALYLFYGAGVLFISAAVIFALLSRAPQQIATKWGLAIYLAMVCISLLGLLWFIFGDDLERPGASFRRYETFDLSMWLAVSVIGLTAVAFLIILLTEFFTAKSLTASYWLRRRLEQFLGWSTIPSFIFLGIAIIPLAAYFIANHLGRSGVAGSSVGLIGVLGGVFSALYGYYTFVRNISPSMAGQIAATLGSLLYIISTLTLSYILAVMHAQAADVFATQSTATIVKFIISASIMLALIIGAVANINYVGLHRFYRDRLMEAFMPTDRSVVTMTTGYSAIADNLSIADITPWLHWDSLGRKLTPRPFPLISTNVILINDSDAKTASRGGANFLISPLHIGSDRTGFRSTKEFIDSTGPLTLATAMAASGAAANASAGFIGTGITTNPLVSSVMALLNMRLGIWIRNPFRDFQSFWPHIPTFLSPGLPLDPLRRKYRYDSGFVELTDGGHFENLALYELIRRKLPLIVIIDGEADSTISLASLVSARNRIEEDFHAKIDWPGEGPERLVLYPAKGYPAGVRYSDAAFAVGKITYCDQSHGTLIYIKSTLIKEMDFATSGYLAANPAFPHQTTVDQFFDPQQFDAYRYLGHVSVKQAIDRLDLETTMSDPEKVLAAYTHVAPKTRE